MKKLLLFILLMSSVLFAQTQPKYFSTYMYTQDDPAAGFSQGLFNPSTSTKNVYIDRVVIRVGFDSDNTAPYVEFGTAIALAAYPSNCTVYGVINSDTTDPGEQIAGGTSTLSVSKYVGQPCTGSIATGNLGATAGTFVDHWACMLNVANNSCTLDLTNRPLLIPPGRGYVIYSDRSFHGTPVFGMEWHEQ